MPRGPKKPGNQHNTRHENGVVAPGKRISKQKSNGHLNGSADATSHLNGLPATSASTSRTTARLPDRRTSGGPTSTGNGVQVAEEPGNIQPQVPLGIGELLTNGTSHANGSVEHTHRKIDVNAAKFPRVHENSIWHFTRTVIGSCPLSDCIAILIVLLSLPPTIITATNFLFAVLTFITPAGSSCLPTTFHEIFQGSGGTPSLATIVLTDVIGLVLWLVLWQPLQALSIELAQAMVATQLGGGNASKKKGSDRTLLCMGIVTASHVARHQWLPKRLFGYDWSAILSSIPYASKNPSLFSGNDFIPSRSPAGWFRVLIALHILIQGLVHVARRWYQKREYSQAVAINKKTDPEAIAGSTSRHSIVAPPEAGPQVAGMSSDPPAKLSPANAKEARDKASSGKKKRRQGTYVRSQQPLWAAFAHTKVIFLREYEQSHTHSESTEANATDTRNLGSARFSDDTGCIWISNVLPTSFSFHASSITMPRPAEAGHEDSKVNATAGIDRSKPFYVRINDTDWTSTRLEASSTDESAGGEWMGEVFGLSPSSSYKCCFVQSGDGAVIQSAIVTTPPPLAAENVSSATSSSSLHRVHRPSSPTTPTTTLKKSITASEASLTEAQARQKKSKKENKAASLALKKDIDVLNAKIAKLGGEDKAHQNRHLQWNQNTKQADEAVNSVAVEIESMGPVPEEDLKQSKESRAAWDKAREKQSGVREKLFRTKESAHQERSAVRTEVMTAQQKRERLLGRKTKLNEQHERLLSTTNQGLDAKQRKDSVQAAKDLERAHLERNLKENMATYQQILVESRFVTQQMWQQAQLVESAFHEQQVMGSTQEERSITPEGELPGTVPHQTPAPGFRFPAFGSPDQSNGLRSHSSSLRHSDHRPRSASLLSGGSVYADIEDEDPAPPMPARAVEVIRERGRKQSAGSGSSGSQRDPASPLVGNPAQISPVGKRSPVWN
ncbi:hypothetical protein JMJ35_001561 [Cladonia borealis]|uniref:Ubiquitination network signaling protein n=1 Tax=Cladonia borealis TaxID=184061 RepID=A0AA39R5Y6_9LECA|nr:hypothetical protein JMJ35_001561 [Cladonia borealis]